MSFTQNYKYFVGTTVNFRAHVLFLPSVTKKKKEIVHKLLTFLLPKNIFADLKTYI